jgi:rhodanese-related sulfurtransferase
MMCRLASALVVLAALAACGGPEPEPAAAPGAASAPAPAPAPAASFRSVSAQDFQADLDAGKVPLLLDVRTVEEYAAGHVAQTQNIPLDTLESRLAELEAHKGAEVYVICQSGRRSERASQLLLSKGFTPVNVEGGTGAWVSAGMPVVEGAAPATP